MSNDAIKVPMTLKLYAGDVLVAEVESSPLFSAVLDVIIKQHPNFLPVPIVPDVSHD